MSSSPDKPGTLADAFGPAALSGLLARRAPAAPVEQPEAPERSSAEEQPAGGSDAGEATGRAVQPTESAGTEEPPRRRGTGGGAARLGKSTSGRKRSPAPSPEPKMEPAPAARDEDLVDDGITSQVSVYLAAEALLAVRRTRRATGQTNADIAFAAIDATHGRLAELVAARRRGVDRPAGSLFPARQSTRPAPGRTRRAVLWAMRATRPELAVVDRLVDQVGAGSRSELIAAAVEAHLLGDRPAR